MATSTTFDPYHITYDPYHLWSRGMWNDTEMLCQEVTPPLGSQSMWADPYYPHGSDSSTIVLLFCVILLATTFTSFVFKPINMPAMSQMFSGVIVIGALFSKNALDIQKLVHPTVFYLLKTFSILGFIFYSFIFGVETNMNAVRGIRKRDFVVCFAGQLTSFLFSFIGYRTLNIKEGWSGLFKVVVMNAQTFFMVTCTHVNDLGISNAEIGRLACKVSLILDVFGIIVTFILFNCYYPIAYAGDYMMALHVIAVYIIMFFIARPLIIYITRFTPEGKRMKDTHFLVILLIVIVIAWLGLNAGQPLVLFMFALSLPEEPLSSILHQRLDSINTSVFLPIFCAMHGFLTDYDSLSRGSVKIEALVLLGLTGKFLGTFVSTKLFGIPLWSALSLGLIMCSKGFLDIVLIGQFRAEGLIPGEQYTVIGLHIVICTMAAIPLVRYLYEPSKHYATILRQGVIASAETGSLETLVCIHREENLPGILRLLEALNPTLDRPMPIIAVQLIQLTGHVTLPILAPFHEVQSSAAFRTNLGRCNRVVSSLLSIERRTDGAARLQHYVSVSPYATMHNDICNLAHDKKVSLIIVPFHIQWTTDGSVENSSQSIRDVNKMVLEKSPCSVGLLVDRGDKEVSILNNVYRIAIFFIGGADDQEALAYTTLIASHPNTRLNVIWLKSKISENNTQSFDDFAVIQDFHNKFVDNEKVCLQEVIVNDGSETTKAIVAIKNEIDLAIVGRYHEPGCDPLFGLSDRWSEYPELGILGDLLVTPEFRFSVLIVQEEHHQKTEQDQLIDDFLM